MGSPTIRKDTPPSISANRLHTTDMTDGTHVISARVTLDNGSTLDFDTTCTVSNPQAPPPDTTAPEIYITAPTSGSSYTSQDATIGLSGTAADNQGLQQITWASSNGASGTASGTATWSIDNIDLVEGDNIITVTANDIYGNTAQDTLTVTFTPTTTVVGLPVSKVTSSGDDGNVAANTIDNDLSTRWSSYGSGQWIQYDLGSYHTISDVLIAFYLGDQRTADLEIFVSDDATSWRSAFRGQSSGATLLQETFSFSNASGRYVRVVGYGNSDNDWVSYTEIDIMGVATDAPDIAAPTVDILSPTQEDTFGTSAKSIQLSGSAADENGVAEVTWNCSTGSSGITSGTSSWSTTQINLQEGSNIITITAKDAAGNMGTDILTVVYQSPDITNPDVTITSPVDTETYITTNSTITLSGTAGDDIEVDNIKWVSSNGSNGTASGTESWSATGIQLSEGQNAITVTATDSAGNQASDILTVTYTPPDTQAPLVNITSPDLPAGGTLQTADGSITISGTAQDDRSVMQVSWTSGNARGTADGTTTWTIPTITLSEGLNTITVKAVDAAGNLGSAELRVEYTIPDSTPPAVTITSPTSSDTYTSGSTAINLAGTASDNKGLSRIVWESATGQSGTASGTESWTISGIQLTEGQNLIAVTATDIAGNTATDTITVTYTAPDTQAPTIAITAPTASGTFTSENGTVDIAGTAGDDRELDRVYLDRLERP